MVLLIGQTVAFFCFVMAVYHLSVAMFWSRRAEWQYGGGGQTVPRELKRSRLLYYRSIFRHGVCLAAMVFVMTFAYLLSCLT